MPARPPLASMPSDEPGTRAAKMQAIKADRGVAGSPEQPDHPADEQEHRAEGEEHRQHGVPASAGVAVTMTSCSLSKDSSPASAKVGTVVETSFTERARLPASGGYEKTSRKVPRIVSASALIRSTFPPTTCCLKNVYDTSVRSCSTGSSARARPQLNTSASSKPVHNQTSRLCGSGEVFPRPS
jgi:hypothetical protein